MRSSTLVSALVLATFGFGCFSSGDDTNACNTPVAIDLTDGGGDSCNATEGELVLVAHGTAELDIGKMAPGKRTATFTVDGEDAGKGSDAGATSEAGEAGDAGATSDAGDAGTEATEPVVALKASALEANGCGVAHVSVVTGRPGKGRLVFDDGSVRVIEVRAPDRIDVTPYFDNFVANLPKEYRRHADSPPGTFGDGTALLAADGTIRVRVRYLSGANELRGRGAARTTTEGGVATRPFEPSSRELIDLVAGAPGTASVRFENSGVRTDLAVRIVPLTDVTQVRLYAEPEDPTRVGESRSARILARALNATGQVVHDAPISMLRGGASIGNQDLISYNYDPAKPGEVITAQSGTAKATITIHPAEKDELQVKDSNDEFASCAMGRGKQSAFGAVGLGLGLLCVLRRRRNGS